MGISPYDSARAGESRYDDDDDDGRTTPVRARRTTMESLQGDISGTVDDRVARFSALDSERRVENIFGVSRLSDERRCYGNVGNELGNSS